MWAAIVFGWPAALGAIATSSAGLLLRRPLLVWAGAVIGLPFMIYLHATPRFWIAATVAAPCHLAAAAALGRRRTVVACLLFLPTPLVTWLVAALVLASR